MSNDRVRVTDEEALQMHASGRPGKLEISLSKPLTTQRDLSLAYSPGVAAPCLEIEKDPAKAYDYTTKGNMVAVVSNGTAVLGLGDLGALASKPVMEGKAALFKRFADVDSIDLCVDTKEVDDFINCVRYLGPSFGGINLEDIKAPECFIIEQRLRELMDIPIFHDDQHGTAIIALAGLINAIALTGRDISTTKLVINGAGAAAIASAELIKARGMRPENVILCDSKGVIYQGRTEGMNQWKSAHAVVTKKRSLAEALDGADIFFGLSVKDAVSKEMVARMAKRPIIFAMANPDPEISPEDVKEVRDDAIIATGRSDYVNQINNVLGFPYIFRGALDVRATTINDAMKLAAAEALAALAREDVPDEVDDSYGGRRLRYGPEYIVPVPFDPRLLSCVAPAVAKAAIDSGVARKPYKSFEAYTASLRGRMDPMASALQRIHEGVLNNPRRVVFAEGEEERVIRAAFAFRNAGYGHPILIGRDEIVREMISSLGIVGAEDLEIHNARLSHHNKRYTDFLYERLQRRGFLYRDCQRMVNQDRNVFAACMVACADADAMVTGVTRNWSVAYDEVRRVIGVKSGATPFGLSIAAGTGPGRRTLFIADTNVQELPSSKEMADIAIATAAKVRQFGEVPRIAFLSFSNFGNPPREKALRIREAVEELRRRQVDFEFDGEMTVDMALDHELRTKFYPFCQLTGPANILLMPALHSAHIVSRLLPMVGGGGSIGPLVIGLEKPVQIVQLRATVADLVNAAALAAHEAVVG